jgi:glycosyltransferase involved in cell wall biosynthesis
MKKIRDTIADYIKRFCPKPSEHPHIVHIGSAIPEKDLAVLYNMCQCYVSPSRGEGWGMPFLESGACGLPVIASRCSGQLDFLTDYNSYLIDIEGYDMGSQEIKEISSYYEGVPFAVLGNKFVEKLKETMRHVYCNYSEAQAKSNLLKEDIENNFTWKHTVLRIAERLSGNDGEMAS